MCLELSESLAKDVPSQGLRSARFMVIFLLSAFISFYRFCDKPFKFILQQENLCSRHSLRIFSSPMFLLQCEDTSTFIYATSYRRIIIFDYHTNFLLYFSLWKVMYFSWLIKRFVSHDVYAKVERHLFGWKIVYMFCVFFVVSAK